MKKAGAFENTNDCTTDFQARINSNMLFLITYTTRGATWRYFILAPKYILVLRFQVSTFIAIVTSVLDNFKQENFLPMK